MELSGALRLLRSSADSNTVALPVSWGQLRGAQETLAPISGPILAKPLTGGTPKNFRITCCAVTARVARRSLLSYETTLIQVSSHSKACEGPVVVCTICAG